MSIKSERTRNLRYKKPALASLGYQNITDELYVIQDECEEIKWMVEDDDSGILQSAFDDNEDEEYEFRMAFLDLQCKAEQLFNEINEAERYGLSEYFDDCTVSLLGNRYNLVGYDSYEEDYFSLVSSESSWAVSETNKRVMRMTKQEIIEKVGQCVGITLAFIDLRQQYDYLKATFDILRDENTSLLQTIKDIEKAYDDFQDSYQKEKEFDLLVKNLPEKMWVE